MKTVFLLQKVVFNRPQMQRSHFSVVQHFEKYTELLKSEIYARCVSAPESWLESSSGATKSFSCCATLCKIQISCLNCAIHASCISALGSYLEPWSCATYDKLDCLSYSIHASCISAPLSCLEPSSRTKKRFLCCTFCNILYAISCLNCTMQANCILAPESCLEPSSRATESIILRCLNCAMRASKLNSGSRKCLAPSSRAIENTMSGLNCAMHANCTSAAESFIEPSPRAA